MSDLFYRFVSSRSRRTVLLELLANPAEPGSQNGDEHSHRPCISVRCYPRLAIRFATHSRCTSRNPGARLWPISLMIVSSLGAVTTLYIENVESGGQVSSL